MGKLISYTQARKIPASAYPVLHVSDGAGGHTKLTPVKAKEYALKNIFKYKTPKSSFTINRKMRDELGVKGPYEGERKKFLGTIFGGVEKKKVSIVSIEKYKKEAEEKARRFISMSKESEKLSQGRGGSGLSLTAKRNEILKRGGDYTNLGVHAAKHSSSIAGSGWSTDEARRGSNGRNDSNNATVGITQFSKSTSGVVLPFGRGGAAPIGGVRQPLSGMPFQKAA